MLQKIVYLCVYGLLVCSSEWASKCGSFGRQRNAPFIFVYIMYFRPAPAATAAEQGRFVGRASTPSQVDLLGWLYAVCGVGGGFGC